jgi:hypothetical protein
LSLKLQLGQDGSDLEGGEIPSESSAKEELAQKKPTAKKHKIAKT